jgi:organic radical activating enzyme
LPHSQGTLAKQNSKAKKAANDRALDRHRGSRLEDEHWGNVMESEVTAKEFDRRNQYVCALPFNGITISARGEITLCCATAAYPLKYLKDVADLNDFYNGAEMDYYRTEMEEGRIGALETCRECFKQNSQGHRSLMTTVNDTWRYALAKDFDADWYLRKQGKAAPLRYLEYTCSNICNQTCATCNSFYSSKWRDIEQQFSVEEKKQFGRHVHDIQTLTDEDIQKIINVLPDLNVLVIKGGEPWADKNNIAILNHALDVNPNCEFLIVSNMQAISESTFKMLEKVKTNSVSEFRVSASIDGTGRVYDWIRGGSFEKTTKIMQRFYEVTGQKINIIPFISILNYFEIERIIEYFADKEYVKGMVFWNISTFPSYIKVQNLPKIICDARQEALSAALPKLQEKMQAAGKFLNYEPILHDIQPNNPFSPADLKDSIQWIEKMNEIRGFRLQDHVSELQEITEAMLAN